MQTESNRPIHTFSIGFTEAQYDEAPYARAVAGHLGTDHTELYVEPRHATEIIPRLSEWFDEPFGDSSQNSNISFGRHDARPCQSSPFGRRG